MKLTDAEIERIKPNFKWHIISPVVYNLPRGLALYLEASAIHTDDNSSEGQNMTGNEEIA